MRVPDGNLPPQRAEHTISVASKIKVYDPPTPFHVSPNYQTTVAVESTEHLLDEEIWILAAFLRRNAPDRPERITAFAQIGHRSNPAPIVAANVHKMTQERYLKPAIKAITDLRTNR